MSGTVQPVFARGECEIDLARRELRIRGAPVPLGGRAFEIIEVLARSPGELITKEELINSIWPGAVVLDNTLQVHAAAIRKALGPYRGWLKTEAGRGYRLLGDWSLRHHDSARQPAGLRQLRVPTKAPAGNFPVDVHLVGRTAAVQQLRDLVSAYRVVTLTGPGGIGKTALALKVARLMLDQFPHGGWLVELTSLTDANLVPSALARTLGLGLRVEDISADAVARAIGTQNLLLMLDNCEHLVDAVATQVETLVRLCPKVTILATSREILRIEGEYAYRVAPLDAPTYGRREPDHILRHSAVELFIARAEAQGSELASRSDILPVVADICRRLDGIPLAIEFAAARAATLGVEQVAEGLVDRFALLTSGRRTALPRHQTLRAVLDWSYELLSDREQRLLRRLAVFSGSFSLTTASAVAAGSDMPQAEIVQGVANLVTKSLVTLDFTGGGDYFRLLEMTRVYAYARLTESGELQELSRRHAEHYRALLALIDNEWEQRSTPLSHIDNARAALEWCFGTGGDLGLGVQLAAVAAPVFLAMSLLPECYRWSERALFALDDTTRGGLEEMHLQSSLGISSMQMYIDAAGQSDAARAALSRSLEIARLRADTLEQVGLLGMLSMFHVRDGDFNTSLHYSQLSRSVDGIMENPAAMALADSISGRALQFAGQHSRARLELEASFRYWSRSSPASEIYFGLDHHVLVGIGLARNLWLQGHPVEAIEQVRQTISDAERKSHPASLGLALSLAPGIFLWIGDLRSAEEHADRLTVHAEAHSLVPYLAVGRGYKGSLAVRRGQPAEAVAELQGCLEQLNALRYKMLNTEFRLSLVQGLVAIGRISDGFALAAGTVGLIEANGDLIYMPEALRVKANVLLSMPERRAADAEQCFLQSLEWSRRQQARSWELRTAIDLARLQLEQGRSESARAVLLPVFEQYVQGLDTADLQAARKLAASLR